MAYGYTGKILRINLTNKSTSTIDTSKYAGWYGGNGMGAAIFWDLVEDKTIDGFDPRNVVTIIGSPLSGTIAPSAGSRQDVMGIGVYAYPETKFTRSNFGGRFPGEMKRAGWDGVVIEGKADAPVWVNIINDEVTIEDASSLWGLDTWETQQVIWREVAGNVRFGRWIEVNGTSTTQRSAVLCIGPAGENLSRIGALIHEGGSGAGQGGFGGVWGSKNLKAISVLGTGGVEIANPSALLEARLKFVVDHVYNVDNPPPEGSCFEIPRGSIRGTFGPQRIEGCEMCPKPDRARIHSGIYTGSQCVDLGGRRDIKKTTEIRHAAADLAQKAGINVYDICAYVRDQKSYNKPAERGLKMYFAALQEMGLLGPGKAIDSDPLPMDKMGTLEFAEAFCRAVSNREGIGDAIAEGAARAAERWGRYEEDTDSGLLYLSQKGYYWHWDLPGVEWGYGTMVSERDINDHDFNGFYGRGVDLDEQGIMTCEQYVNLAAERIIPYTGDPFMFNRAWEEPEASETGIYSESAAKCTAWHRHYALFYKQSLGFCDQFWFDLISGTPPDYVGQTPLVETTFLNAVTGGNLSFTDGLKIGKKIFMLERAINILRGNHRDKEVMTGFMYKPGASHHRTVPVYKNGEWSWVDGWDMVLDKAKVEEWKTKFYEFEGCDTSTGWPTRATLEELDLGYVADELEAAGKLGSG